MNHLIKRLSLCVAMVLAMSGVVAAADADRGSVGGGLPFPSEQSSHFFKNLPHIFYTKAVLEAVINNKVSLDWAGAQDSLSEQRSDVGRCAEELINALLSAWQESPDEEKKQYLTKMFDGFFKPERLYLFDVGLEPVMKVGGGAGEEEEIDIRASVALLAARCASLNELKGYMGDAFSVAATKELGILQKLSEIPESLLASLGGTAPLSLADIESIVPYLEYGQKHGYGDDNSYHSLQGKLAKEIHFWLVGLVGNSLPRSLELLNIPKKEIFELGSDIISYLNEYYEKNKKSTPGAGYFCQLILRQYRCLPYEKFPPALQWYCLKEYEQAWLDTVPTASDSSDYDNASFKIALFKKLHPCNGNIPFLFDGCRSLPALKERVESFFSVAGRQKTLCAFFNAIVISDKRSVAGLWPLLSASEVANAAAHAAFKGWFKEWVDASVACLQKQCSSPATQPKDIRDYLYAFNCFKILFDRRAFDALKEFTSNDSSVFKLSGKYVGLAMALTQHRSVQAALNSVLNDSVDFSLFDVSSRLQFIYKACQAYTKLDTSLFTPAIDSYFLSLDTNLAVQFIFAAPELKQERCDWFMQKLLSQTVPAGGTQKTVSQEQLVSMGRALGLLDLKKALGQDTASFLAKLPSNGHLRQWVKAANELQTAERREERIAMVNKIADVRNDLTKAAAAVEASANGQTAYTQQQRAGMAVAAGAAGSAVVAIVAHLVLKKSLERAYKQRDALRAQGADLATINKKIADLQARNRYLTAALGVAGGVVVGSVAYKALGS